MRSSGAKSIVAGLYFGKYLEYKFQSIKGQKTWKEWVETNLHFSYSHCDKMRALWNSLGKYALFQHVPERVSYVLRYAVCIAKYLAENEEEAQWWSGESDTSPPPLYDRDPKGKTKVGRDPKGKTKVGRVPQQKK
jgi:hypothetical protein